MSETEAVTVMQGYLDSVKNGLEYDSAFLFYHAFHECVNTNPAITIGLTASVFTEEKPPPRHIAA